MLIWLKLNPLKKIHWQWVIIMIYYELHISHTEIEYHFCNAIILYEKNVITCTTTTVLEKIISGDHNKLY